MKPLQKIMLVCFMLFTIACSNNSVEKLKLQYQTIATTIDPVSCDGYENMFGETDKEVEITKQETLSKLVFDFTESEEKRINVRGKITIVYDNRQDVYCFDQFGLFYMNGKFYKNQLLWRFLEQNYIEKFDNEVLK